MELGRYRLLHAAGDARDTPTHAERILLASAQEAARANQFELANRLRRVFENITDERRQPKAPRADQVPLCALQGCHRPCHPTAHGGFELV